MNSSMALAKGKVLAILLCLMVLFCLNQRALGERLSHHHLSSPVVSGSLFLPEESIQSHASGYNDNGKISICELSAKSLLPLFPLALEPLFIWYFTLAALTLLCYRFPRRAKQRSDKYPPPRVRLHLQFCNLRD
ncbi:metal resistance protein [Moellerella wisconsensis]|uniref:metal resistance protein n=1 Tax=Moellerella wisconsensis TaxID=158849 RepID=UPI003075F54E